MQAAEVLAALAEAHEYPAALFPEQPVSAVPGAQRIDLYVVAPDGTATAYEIKCTRADFLAEINAPAKRRPAMRISNRFTFVCPPGVVRDFAEVPLDCGLWIIDGPDDLPGERRTERLTVAVPSPYRDRMPPTWDLLAAIARRSIHPDREIARLARAEVARARRRLLLAREGRTS